MSKGCRGTEGSFVTAVVTDGDVVATDEEAAGFAGLGLAPELCRALAGLGYEEPTPIQKEAIPPILDGKDLVGQAATGTGKTAAFALPLLQRLRGRGPRARPAPRPDPRADAGAGDASGRGRPSLRAPAGNQGAADLRRPGL